MIPSRPSLDELKTLAIELQDLVQSKVGTTKFSTAYSRIRQSVLSVRRERRTARVMQVRVSHGVSVLLLKSITGNNQSRGRCETEASEKFYQEGQSEEEEHSFCVRLPHHFYEKAILLTCVNVRDNKGRIKRRREE